MRPSAVCHFSGKFRTLWYFFRTANIGLLSASLTHSYACSLSLSLSLLDKFNWRAQHILFNHQHFPHILFKHTSQWFNTQEKNPFSERSIWNYNSIFRQKGEHFNVLIYTFTTLFSLSHFLYSFHYFYSVQKFLTYKAPRESERKRERNLKLKS